MDQSPCVHFLAVVSWLYRIFNEILNACRETISLSSGTSLELNNMTTEYPRHINSAVNCNRVEILVLVWIYLKENFLQLFTGTERCCLLFQDALGVNLFHSLPKSSSASRLESLRKAIAIFNFVNWLITFLTLGLKSGLDFRVSVDLSSFES